MHIELSMDRPAVPITNLCQVRVRLVNDVPPFRTVTSRDALTFRFTTAGRGAASFEAVTRPAKAPGEFFITGQCQESGACRLTASVVGQALASNTLHFDILPVVPAPVPRQPCGDGAEPAVDTLYWSNWHGNIERDVRVVRPTTKAELIAAVRSAERNGARLGVQGSGWSFTDCVVGAETNLVIDTSALHRPLDLPSLVVVSPGPRPVLQPRPTLFPGAFRRDVREAAAPLVWVEAGMKVFELNCLLASRGLAMGTLGGSHGQSIAGVISTGVHGSDPGRPPLADAVAALHLVGPGGQEWWIEPASDPVTNPLAMARARERGLLCPSTRIEYDDDLFNAALVSFGCAGVIYSVVLRAEPAYHLHEIRRGISWDDARAYLARLAAGDASSPRYVDINVNPMDFTTRIRERFEAPVAPLTPPAESCSLTDVLHYLLVAGAVVPGFVAVAVGLPAAALATALAAYHAAVADYIARATARGVALGAIPFVGPALALREFTRTARTVGESFDVLARIPFATGAHFAGDDSQLAELIPRALNVIWKLGGFVSQGKELVEWLQNKITAAILSDGEAWGPSHEIRTKQPRCGSTPASHEYGPLERLVASYEFALPVDQAARVVERIHDIVRSMRDGDDALMVNINLRFTTRTRALLGMQQFDRTCHFEVYGFHGMAGNASFFRQLEELTRSTGAMPHWGQFHNDRVDFETLLGDRLTRWRRAMRHLATGGGETAEPSRTFMTPFAQRRRLLI